MRFTNLPGLALLSFATATVHLTPTDVCPLLGPTFTSSFSLAKTQAFQTAIKIFPDVIKELLASKVVTNTTSFVIDVYSTYTNQSLYTYTHEAAAPVYNETIVGGKLNDETIIRIGSVSKLFTAYAILVAGGGLSIFDSPVTKFLPELVWRNGTLDPLVNVNWEEITIGALASHQGNSAAFPLEIFGCLPSKNDTCIAQHLELLREVKVPIQPVFQSALYSDGGFGVLGRVLERMTGLPYGEAIQSVLNQPLGLNHTTTFIPKDDPLNAIVIPGPIEQSSWEFENQITAPSGGVYSNAADFRALGLSILNSKLLSPATTRAWMKPRAHTASLTISIGAPWEIYRLTLPVSQHSTRTRISDIYTKGGGNSGYTAIFALSPDHQLGYSVMVAGAGALSDRWPLRAAAGQVFVAAAEDAAWENAKANFVGTFSDEAGSNLTLTVDKDLPGLGLKTLFIDGINFLPQLLQPGLVLPPGRGVVVRVYPTGLEEVYADGKKVVKYRTVAQVTPLRPKAEVESGVAGILFDDSCLSFFNAGFFQTEQDKPIDELLFEVKDGKLVSVSSVAVGKAMKRV